MGSVLVAICGVGSMWVYLVCFVGMQFLIVAIYISVSTKRATVIA